MSHAVGRCCCPHPDAHECAILRRPASMSQEEAEEDARHYGGCECACHRENEDEDEDDTPYWEENTYYR